jgi:hypothetical protein
MSREDKKRRKEEQNRAEAAERRAQAAQHGKSDSEPSQSPSAAAGPHPESEPLPLNPAISQLLRLALTQEDVFHYLNEQAAEGELPWRGHVGGELLESILNSELRPGDAASQALFLENLRSEDRTLLGKILLEQHPQDSLAGASTCLLLLRRDALRSYSEVLTQKLRQPGMPAEEVTALLQELMQIKKLLVELGQKIAGALKIPL